jgi:hypothetical protein
MKPRSLVPLAQVRSVKRSVEFYQKIGFVVEDTHAPEGSAEAVWASLASGGARLMVAEADVPIDRGQHDVMFYIYTPDVAAFRDTVIEAGVEAGPIRHPFFSPRGEFEITDPDGYVLMVSHT